MSQITVNAILWREIILGDWSPVKRWYLTHFWLKIYHNGTQRYYNGIQTYQWFSNKILVSLPNCFLNKYGLPTTKTLKEETKMLYRDTRNSLKPFQQTNQMKYLFLDLWTLRCPRERLWLSVYIPVQSIKVFRGSSFTN